MNILHRLLRLWKDKSHRFNVLDSFGFYNHMPDEKYLKYKFKFTLGYDLNLAQPQTFNEKLQWLKLYDRNPLYTIMVDKYKAKEYVANIIGKEHIVPILGVWDSPNEIDFDKLPNQFVLKCNHNSGLGMCICKDKRKLDIKKVKKELTKSLKQDYYLTNREWPYKNVPRKIIAEKYLDDHSGHELTDYKFMCFNKSPKIVYLTNKAKVIHENFYDMNFQPLNINRNFIRLSPEFEKPAEFAQMKELAKKLAAISPFIRVDFFLVNHHIYFGEFTFYDWAGFKKFTNPKWETLLGSWISLPSKIK